MNVELIVLTRSVVPGFAHLVASSHAKSLTTLFGRLRHAFI